MEQSNKSFFKFFGHKAISIVGVAVFLFHSTTICAQIKIVGDDYSSQLTASKSYYEEDVDFEKYFPSINNTEIVSLSPRWSNSKKHNVGEFILWDFACKPTSYWELNLSGDTVYLPEDVLIESRIEFIQKPEVIYSTKFYPVQNDFCIDNTGKPVNRTMKKGYYEVVGYVFCSDNADSLRALYKLGQPVWYHEWQEKLVVLNWPNQTDIKSLKENILKGEVDRISEYIQYIIFRPLDSEEKSVQYYLSYRDRFREYLDRIKYAYGKPWFHSVIHQMMPLRFYNVAKTCIGEEVVLCGETMQTITGGLLEDSISNRLIKIMDSVFVVEDIVMKGTQYYAILKGLNTGSFALPLHYIFSTNTIENTIPFFDDWGDLVGGEIGGDILYLATENREGLFKKKDLEILRKRKLIAHSQLVKERNLKEQQRKQAQAKADAAFRQQMLTKHGDKFGKLVASKQVSLDMTKEMCRDAWGKPINTYRTTTKYGQSEVWCYNYKTRVYFYNGKVVQIDD